MTQLSWLHLSDLGMSPRGSQWMRPDFSEEFERDLRRMHERTGPWDLVLITGDLTDTGSEREFMTLNQRLETFFSYLHALGSHPVLFAVPGNHDMNMKTMLSAPWWQYPVQPPEREAFWEDEGHPLRQVIRRGFEPFLTWMTRWHKEHGDPTGCVKAFQSGVLPGDFAATLVKDDLRVGIAGLNSAYLAFFTGNLDVILHQANAVANGSMAQWFEDKSLSLILTHHSPTILDPAMRSRFYADTKIPSSLVFQLCGSRSSQSDPPLSHHEAPMFQAPSLFGGEPDGPWSNSPWRYGYAVGRLDLSEGKREVKIFPRVMQVGEAKSKLDDAKRPTMQFAMSGPPALIADTTYALDEDEAITVSLAMSPAISDPPVQDDVDEQPDSTESTYEIHSFGFAAAEVQTAKPIQAPAVKEAAPPLQPTVHDKSAPVAPPPAPVLEPSPKIATAPVAPSRPDGVADLAAFEKTPIVRIPQKGSWTNTVPTAASHALRSLTSTPTTPEPELPVGIDLRTTIDTGSAVTGWIAWSPSGKALAIGLSDGKLFYWDLEFNQPTWTVQGHKADIGDICFSPDGRWLASRSETQVRIWEPQQGSEVATIDTGAAEGVCIAWSTSGLLASGFYEGSIRFWHEDSWNDAGTAMYNWPMALAVYGMAWSADGHTLVCAGEGGGLIEIWDIQGGDPVAASSRAKLSGHTNAVLDVAYKPKSTLLASASRDKTIRIWDTSPAASTPLLAVLEGHTDVVTSVSFSADGRLLASKSLDGTIRLYRTDTWTEILQIPEPVLRLSYVGLAFSPTEPILASLGVGGRGVRLWDIDIETLLHSTAPADAHQIVREVSAKVVLVGEGRAGKSCLALRLAQNRYEELTSTHGMQFWSLPAQQLDPESTIPRGERREVILWDMGGQEEYRLVHQLFFRDTTVALMIMEPGRGQPALDEIEGWNQRLAAQIRGAQGLRKLLVGTKVDNDVAPIDLPSIHHAVQRFQFTSYVSTSAKTAFGIDALKTALAKAIDWTALGTTSRPELFQRIRRHIKRLRDTKRVVLTFLELTDELRAQESSPLDLDAMEAVVAQLAKQGVVADTRMADGTRALILEVEQVERYASSLILLARNNPQGVPAIDVGMVLAQPHFPRIQDADRLRRDQEMIVIDCVVELLLDHGICLRHEGLLIFPSLFQPTQQGPAPSFGHAVSLFYDFSGATGNTYASLVAALAMSRWFGPMRLWEDRAEFGRPGQDGCGVRKVHGAGQHAKGLAHLDIYFDLETPEAIRDLFVNFIEDHLKHVGVDIVEQLVLTCVCGKIFLEDDVRERLSLGQNDIGCPKCDRRTPLTLGAKESREKNPDIATQVLALRTNVKAQRAQSVIETKMSLNVAQRTNPMTEPIRILHLSDLHVGKGADPETLMQPLAADLRDKEEGLGVDSLDYLVVSGDITNRAAPEEFEKARDFISAIIRDFRLTAERCILVPGNHDLDWDTEVYTWKKRRQIDIKKLVEGSYIEQGDGYNVRDDAKYPDRFKNFSQVFYHPLVLKEYPLMAEQQHIPSFFTDTRLQFLAMNSSWEIDEYFTSRSGIHDGALSRCLIAADQQIAAARGSGQLPNDAKILRMAVWHHPVTGNEKMQSDAFMTRLQQAGVKLCLHGHVHEDRADLVGYLHPTRKVHVVGAGSFGAPTHDRPESVPRLYNLMEVDRDHSKIRVYTRCLRKTGGAWEGWAVWPGQSKGEKRTYYDVLLNAPP